MKKKPDFEDLRDSFLRVLLLENMSPVTVRGVKYPINFFIKYLRLEGINDLARVNVQVIDGYRRWLYKQKNRAGEPLAPGTIIARLVWLCKFFSYLKKRGHIMVDPCFGMKMPKSEVKIPRDVMNEQEVSKIMAQPDLRDPLGYRDRTIMEVLYSTGARNSELCNMKLEDVSLNKREIMIVRGKGDKLRIVPLNQVAIRFLERYLTKIRPYLVKDDREEYVFVGKFGRKIQSGVLMEMIKKYREQAGLKKKISPHSFRHTMATQLLDNGMNVRYIQAILGHESLKSTQIYTRVAVKSLGKKHKQYHPREKMKWGMRDEVWGMGDGREKRKIVLFNSNRKGIRNSELYPGKRDE